MKHTITRAELDKGPRVDAEGISHCPVCDKPAHASESDDLDRHAECQPAEVRVPAKLAERRQLLREAYARGTDKTTRENLLAQAGIISHELSLCALCSYPVAADEGRDRVHFKCAAQASSEG